MKVHRFYVPDIQLEQDFWLHDKALLHQWNKVLRFHAGGEAVLFDGRSSDRLYEIVEISTEEAHLRLKTEMKRKLPDRHIYLFWSLLKRDNNELILQKCTELGISNFVPIISERSIRKDFNIERAKKIAIEAAEQCGRSDVPAVREPLKLETALNEYKNKIDLIYCDKQGENSAETKPKADKPIGIFIGPEGGWTDEEKKLFTGAGAKHLNIHDLTLRAETAAVVAVARLI